MTHTGPLASRLARAWRYVASANWSWLTIWFTTGAEPGQSASSSDFQSSNGRARHPTWSARGRLQNIDRRSLPATWAVGIRPNILRVPW